MVSMTNGEMTHDVKDADVQRFEAAGWAKVQPAKPKPEVKKQSERKGSLNA